MTENNRPRLVQVPTTSQPKHLCETCTAGMKLTVGLATPGVEPGTVAITPMPTTVCSEGYFCARDGVSMMVMECDGFEEEDDEDDEQTPAEVSDAPAGQVRDVPAGDVQIPDGGTVVDPDNLTDAEIDAIHQHVIDQTKADPDYVPVGAEKAKS